MLSIIGKSRIVTLVSLVFVCVGIWIAAFSMIQPHYDNVILDHQDAVQKSSDYRARIEKMEQIAGLMNDRGGEYQNITDKGVRPLQDRVKARRTIQDVKFSTEIPFLQYRISEEKEQTDAMINEKGYKLSQSEMEFDIKAYTAMDIFGFIETLKQRFDGHIVLKDMNIKKEDSALGSDQSTAAISGTQNQMTAQLLYPRIEAKLNFTWNSLTESEESALMDDDMFGATDF